MECWRMFDSVKFEKEKAAATFNRFRGNGVVALRRFCEVLAVFGLISWSPAVLEFAGGFFVELSAYASNHHVVFLVGNAIIVLVFVLCRQNDVSLSAGGGDFYDDYVKFSEAAAHQREPPLPPSSDMENSTAASESSGVGGDDEKQIVVCDDVAAAVEKATKQIKKFQRTYSEQLNGGRAARRRPELRRSETESCRKTETLDVAEIETLSGEEFQRIVDSFIDKHWGKRTTKQIQFPEHDNYHQLVKMA